MGTNYYWHRGASRIAPGVVNYGTPRHVGKSSVGWTFALHVYPDEGINGLGDWIEMFRRPGSTIEDEYHKVLSEAEMLDVICNRSRAEGFYRDRIADPKFAASWYGENDAEPGPCGLARRRIRRFAVQLRDGSEVGAGCIGHGMGTWDLVVGDFS